MTKLQFLLFFTPWLAQAASSVYTGFNYGAFWGTDTNVKQVADFLDGFNLAGNLSTDVPFNSARLFTCTEAGTLNDPTGAFDAAVESKTNLLLGFWISPAKRGDPTDELVNNEMMALEKGFQKHGQALADLVIGLSVGNEDIYRWEDTSDSGVAADAVSQTIDKVKGDIAASSFAQYMKDKPIGHVDIAQYAAVDNADFVGFTAYPYWNNDSIAAANASFFGSLEGVKQRAGNRSVWIAEMGWPFQGPQRSGAVASADNLQKFWTDVGCSVFGLYNTFWFELLQDSTPDQPDWGLIDIPSRQPRIKNLKCLGAVPNAPNPSLGNSQPAPPAAPTIPLNATTQSVSPVPPVSSSVQTVMGTSSMAKPTSTMHVITTIYITVQGTPLSLQLPVTDTTVIEEITTTVTTTETVHVKPSTASPSTTSIPADRPWCVTVADIDRSGNLVTVAGGPAGPDGQCSTPQMDAFVQPTPLPIATPWCVTVADIDRNNHPLPVTAGPAGSDGKCSEPPTYTGWPYASSTQTVAPNVPANSGEGTTILPTSVPAPLSPAPLPSSAAGSSDAPSTSEATVSSTTPASSTTSQIPVPSLLSDSGNSVLSSPSSSQPYCIAKSKRLAVAAASAAPS